MENSIAEAIGKLKRELPSNVKLVAVSKFHPAEAVMEAYSAGPVAAMVESVDSLHLLEAIDRWGMEHGKVIQVLLEFHIASEDTKQGFSREEILDIVSKAGNYGNVCISGLMGMATFTDDEGVIRKDFAKLVALRDEIRSGQEKYPGLPDDFGILSFGMTHDYRIAVEMGADMVRIGTLIFGERNY